MMKSSIFYLRLAFHDENAKDILIGLKNSNISKKWLKNLREALHYQEYAIYAKPIPIIEGIVEILDDEKNTINLHKRKM